MKNYLFFPTGFEGTNVYNDNIDINVGIVRDDGSVALFVATLFSRENIISFLEKDGYIWASDMIIVEKLEITVIKDILNKLIRNKEETAMCFVRKYTNEKSFSKDLGEFVLVEF